MKFVHGSRITEVRNFEMPFNFHNRDLLIMCLGRNGQTNAGMRWVYNILIWNESCGNYLAWMIFWTEIFIKSHLDKNQQIFAVIPCMDFSYSFQSAFNRFTWMVSWFQWRLTYFPNAWIKRAKFGCAVQNSLRLNLHALVYASLGNTQKMHFNSHVHLYSLYTHRLYMKKMPATKETATIPLYWLDKEPAVLFRLICSPGGQRQEFGWEAQCSTCCHPSSKACGDGICFYMFCLFFCLEKIPKTSL